MPVAWTMRPKSQAKKARISTNEDIKVRSNFNNSVMKWSADETTRIKTRFGNRRSIMNIM